MQKLTITIALTVIALALGTTTITTQIQPAYSQVSHCSNLGGGGVDTCITSGQNPSIFACSGSVCTEPDSITHQQAGPSIASQYRGCAHGAAECFIKHP
jgi:hypothetical protein